MPGTFQVTDSLPATGCTEQDHYDLIETIIPTAAVVDPGTMEILAGKFYCNLLVPRWKKFTVTHTDLQTAGLTNDIELFTLPGGGIIERIMMKHSEAFAGAGISDYDISVGIAGNLTKYAAAFDVDQAIGDTVFALVANAGCETFNSGGASIRVSAVSVGANLDQTTAGSLDIWVKYGAAI